MLFFNVCIHLSIMALTFYAIFTGSPNYFYVPLILYSLWRLFRKFKIQSELVKNADEDYIPHGVNQVRTSEGELNNEEDLRMGSFSENQLYDLDSFDYPESPEHQKFFCLILGAMAFVISFTIAFTILVVNPLLEVLSEDDDTPYPYNGSNYSGYYGEPTWLALEWSSCDETTLLETMSVICASVEEDNDDNESSNVRYYETLDDEYCKGKGKRPVYQRKCSVPSPPTENGYSYFYPPRIHSFTVTVTYLT